MKPTFRLITQRFIVILLFVLTVLPTHKGFCVPAADQDKVLRGLGGQPTRPRIGTMLATSSDGRYQAIAEPESNRVVIYTFNEKTGVCSNGVSCLFNTVYRPKKLVLLCAAFCFPTGSMRDASGDLLAVGFNTGQVYLYGFDGALRKKLMIGRKQGVCSLAFNATGDLMLVGTTKGDIQLWKWSWQSDINPYYLFTDKHVFKPLPVDGEPGWSAQVRYLGFIKPITHLEVASDGMSFTAGDGEGCLRFSLDRSHRQAPVAAQGA